MNFQQRYLRLSKEIKNIKEAQSKVVLDLRSVVYTSDQAMHYDHYWGTYSRMTVYIEDENGGLLSASDIMSQIYCTCSSTNVYLDVVPAGTIFNIAARRPAAWETGTWTVNVKVIVSKKVPRIRIYNSYTGTSTIITEGEIIG